MRVQAAIRPERGQQLVELGHSGRTNRNVVLVARGDGIGRRNAQRTER